MADLTPYNAGRRLARGTQQAFDYQQHVALVRAKSIQSIAFVGEVAQFSVAGLTNLETELVKQAPLAEPRLRSVVDTATLGINIQQIRLAQDLG
jgi:hypothetical protein